MTARLLRVIWMLGCALPMLAKAQFTVNGMSSNAQDTFYVCQNTPAIIKSGAAANAKLDWVFTGANPGNSSARQEVLLYASLGTYKINQTVNDTIQVVKTVIISNTKPTADFSYKSPASLCGNENFSFTNASTGTGLKYKWYFGGCSTVDSSTGANPVKKFDSTFGNQLAVCDITLITTNDLGCSDTIVKPITYKQYPDFNVTDDNPNSPNGSTFRACGVPSPHVITFKNNSTTDSTNASYQVRWGNVLDTTWPADKWPPGAAGVIKKTFTEGYSPNKMNITIVGENGCTVKATYDIYVSYLSAPVGTLTASVPTINCAPAKINFAFTDAALNSPGTSTTFTINDNSPTQKFGYPPPDSVDHIFNKSSCYANSVVLRVNYPNAFFASLSITNPCGTKNSFITPIRISSKPVAAFSAQSDDCVNKTATFTNTGVYNKNIQPAGNSGRCDSTGKTVWVISPNNYVLESGTTGNLNGNSTDINNWDTGSQQIKIHFTKPGSYRVKMYIGNINCGTDSTEQVFLVRSLTQFNMSSKTVCTNANVVVLNTTQSENASIPKLSSFKWDVTRLPDGPGCNAAGIYNFINGTTDTSNNIALRFTNAGVYEIKLSEIPDTSHQACAGDYTDTIAINLSPKASINAVNNICRSDSIFPRANISTCFNAGANVYKWTFQNGIPASSDSLIPGSIKYDKPGRYLITLQVTNNCASSIDSVYVQVSEGPVVNKVRDTLLCSNNTLGFKLSTNVPNADYSWVSNVITNGNNLTGNSSQSRLSNNVINDYLVNTGTTNAIVEYKIVAFEPAPDSCIGDTIVVRVTVTPRISAGADARICLGSTASLAASGPNVIKWNWSPGNVLSNTSVANPLTTKQLTQTTAFIVQGVNSFGCSNQDTVQVEVIQPVTLSVQPSEGYLCLGDSIQLQVNGGINYKWSPAASLNFNNIADPKASPKTTTTYTISGTDINQCATKTAYLTVNVGTQPKVDLGNGSKVVATTTVPLEPFVTNGPFKSYKWTSLPADAGYIECVDPPLCSKVLASIRDNVSFKVEVENIYGCIQYDTISFQASCIKEKQLFVPNAFSPNNDGINDVFTVRGYGFIIKHIQIFNRWGQQVFERKDVRPNDKSAGWNGKTATGQFAPADQYIIQMDLICNDGGGSFAYKGTISLLH